MKHYNKVSRTILLLLLICSCKDTYSPPVLSVNNAFLVVEGSIGGTIKLSRSLKLADTATVSMESNARVSIEGSGGIVYNLSETTPGVYAASQMALNPGEKYKLHISTANNAEYVSDDIIYKQTPPVDVGWTRDNTGVHIYFSAQDPQNNTHYYKWNFEETWEIITHYEARFKYENSLIVPNIEVKNMSHCWNTNKPSNVRLISTVPLVKDIIEREPLVLIPAGDEKIDIRYSILVNLSALDKQGYDFYQLLKKNTESLGSIFDAQPSELTGNIHCITNPQEKIIGYVMGSPLQEKRIFISKNDVPDWNYNPKCATIYAPNTSEDILQAFSTGDYIPYAQDGIIPIKGYYGVEQRCADCRLSGGNNDKPGFW